MFKSGWIIALAIGLTALSGQAQENQEQPQGAASQQQAAPNQLPVPLPVVIVEAEEAAIARERAEEESAEREKKDLVAQEGMYDEAERVADYAFAQTILIAIGTIALLWTLILTRRATVAAQEAVDVTREIGNAQVRAYLYVSACNIECFDNSPNEMVVSLEIKNGGQTPAISIFEVLIFGTEEPWPDWNIPEIGLPRPPVSRDPVKTLTNLTEAEVVQVRTQFSANKYVTVRGAVYYRDIGQNHYRSDFRFIVQKLNQGINVGTATFMDDVLQFQESPKDY